MKSVKNEVLFFFFYCNRFYLLPNLYSQQEAKERQFNNEAKSTHLTTYSQIVLFLYIWKHAK